MWLMLLSRAMKLSSSWRILLSASLLILLTHPALARLIGKVKKVGASSWLKPLDDGERAEGASRCGNSPSSTPPPNRTALNSGRNGQLAIPGQFKSAAELAHAMIYPDGSRHGFCGATFISRRHLLTTRQCIDFGGMKTAIMAGGVCYDGVKEMTNCPKVDMEVLNIDVAIMGRQFYPTPSDDYGLIQLKEPVPDALWLSRVEFDCLPPPLAQQPSLPEVVIARGWSDDSKGTNLRHLRYAYFLTRPRPAWSIKEDKLPHCTLPHGYCTYSQENEVNVSMVPMVSMGNGQVTKRGNMGSVEGKASYTLHGVASGEFSILYSTNVSMREPEKIWTVGAVSPTTSVLDDICYYLRLCAPSVLGLNPQLRLSTYYITSARGDHADLAPFKSISTAASKEITSQSCIAGALSRAWSALLVIASDADNATISGCRAAMVTPRHLITVSPCVIDLLRAGKKAKAKLSDHRLWVLFCSIRLSREEKNQCLADPANSKEAIRAEVDHIAWENLPLHGKRAGMAIVQLKRDISRRLVYPVCIDDLEAARLSEMGLLASANETAGMSSGCPREVDSGVVCDVKMPRMNPSLGNQQKNSSLVLLPGSPQMDSSNGRLVGLFLFREANHDYYLSMPQFKATLCTFLNLDCKPDGEMLFVADPVLWFDRFVFSLLKPPLKSYQCGIVAGEGDKGGSPKRFILNSTTTTTAKYPWMVPVWMSGGSCSGSIVAPRFVLTAAHCVCFRELPTPDAKCKFNAKFVAINVSDAGSLDEKNPPPGVTVLQVKKSTFAPRSHCPRYASKTPKEYWDCEDDIALIELEEPIPFGENGEGIQPICLSEEFIDEEGKAVVIAGYGGIRDPAGGNALLKEAPTLLINSDNCKRNVSRYVNVTTLSRETNICILGVTPPASLGNRSCSIVTENGTCLVYGATFAGDSGGTVKSVDAKGRWTQLGVVSWGVNEVVKRVESGTVAPDIFVRVSAFCSWMLEVSRGEVECDYWKKRQ